MRAYNRIATGQRGSVLLISLIILIVLTMLGIAAIRLGITNLLATNNMQARQEAQAAAEEVINKQVLSINFLNNANVDTALNALANTPYYYAAGSKNYQITLTRPCLKSMAMILSTDPLLDPMGPYKECRVDDGTSLCYRAMWEVQATVSSGFLGATTQMAQGFHMIMGFKDSVNVASITSNFYCAPM